MIKLTVKELEELYRKKTNKELCKMLGITPPTLAVLLKRHGIEGKGKGNFKLKEQIQVI